MACTDKRSEQISDFASGKLSEIEADNLLDHILVCADCAKEFDMVADLVTCVDRYGNELLRLHDESVISRASNAFRDILESLKKRWVDIPVPVRVLAPAAVAAVVAFVLLYPQGDDIRYSHLAQFEVPRYIPRSLRGVGLNDNIKMLFEEGMSAYTKKDYVTAIDRLSEVTGTQPEFGEAFFYLGIAYLMNDVTKKAIEILQQAADLLEGYPLGEQSHWYLGMAHLRLEKRDSALREFQRVADLNGMYKVDALNMIEKIKNVKSGIY